MRGLDSLDAPFGTKDLHHLQLGIGIGREMVYGDDNRNAEAAQIFDMTAQIGATGSDGIDVLAAQIALLHAAIHLQGANGGNEHRHSGFQPALAALDIEEFLGAQIGSETGLGDDIVGQA